MARSSGPTGEGGADVVRTAEVARSDRSRTAVLGYAILGLLAVEPLTGYQLAQRIRAPIGYTDLWLRGIDIVALQRERVLIVVLWRACVLIESREHPVTPLDRVADSPDPKSAEWRMPRKPASWDRRGLRPPARRPAPPRRRA